MHLTKNLLGEYYYRFFKCFQSAQRAADAELFLLLIKRRMSYPEVYVLSSTMETFVALKWNEMKWMKWNEIEIS